MTTREAADLLGIDFHSVAKAIKRGKLHAAKRGRDYWIEPEDVARYASERRAVGRPKKVV